MCEAKTCRNTEKERRRQVSIPITILVVKPRFMDAGVQVRIYACVVSETEWRLQWYTIMKYLNIAHSWKFSCETKYNKYRHNNYVLTFHSKLVICDWSRIKYKNINDFYALLYFYDVWHMQHFIEVNVIATLQLDINNNYRKLWYLASTSVRCGIN